MKIRNFIYKEQVWEHIFFQIICENLGNLWVFNTTDYTDSHRLRHLLLIFAQFLVKNVFKDFLEANWGRHSRRIKNM